MHVRSSGCSFPGPCPAAIRRMLLPARRASIRSLVTAALMAATVGGAVQAQTGNNTVVYSEDFDSQSAENWSLSSNWHLQALDDGFALRGDGQVHAHAGYSEASWTDWRLRCRIMLENDRAHVSYRDSDAGRYYLSVSSSGTVLNKQVNPDTLLENIASGAGISYGNWQTLEIDGTGGTLTVYLDGVDILTYSDPDPLTAGGIFFESFDAPFWVDDVEVFVPADQASPPDLVWIGTGGPPGGLGYDIRYKSVASDVWYVTEGNSGLHISHDDGRTWTASNDGIKARTGRAGDIIPVFSVTVDPHDSNVVWAGTQNTGDIYKSTDGGQTWTEKTGGIPEDISFALSFRGFTVDPRGSSIVYAMAELASRGWTSDGSARTGAMFDMTQGVVYKTIDGGERWTEIWRGDNLARYCWIDPRDPDVLYVSTGIFDREAANTDVEAGVAGGVGIIKSTDGGLTWRVLNEDNGLSDLYVGSLSMYPTDPDVLLAAATHDFWSVNRDEHPGGVFMTENAGETWERVVAPANDGEEFTAIEYCTSDPAVAYAGTTDAIYRSDDGGYTWQRFTNNERWGPPGLPAGFPIDLQCDATNPMRLFANSYLGGNFLSTDGGRTWTIAAEGYTGALVRHLLVAPGKPGTVVIGGRTGVLRTDDGGETWTGLSYAPPEWPDATLAEIRTLAMNPTDPDHLLAAPWDIFNVVVSRDGGLSWNLADGLSTGQVGPVDLAFAPSSPSRVYAAVAPDECRSDPREAIEGSGGNCDITGMGLYVSDDGGETWAATGGAEGRNKAVIAVAVHPEEPMTVIASMPTSGVYKSTDGGEHWTSIGSGLSALPALVLTIDPKDANVIFAGLSEDAVYRSTDGGVSWTQSSAGLNPTAEVHSVVIDPTNSQRVYAADAVSGVYRSNNGGDTWVALNAGLDQRAVNDLAISDDGAFLYAGTEGGGVFRLDLDGTPPPATDWPDDEAETTDDGDSPADGDEGDPDDAPATNQEDAAQSDGIGGTDGFCGMGMIGPLLCSSLLLFWKEKRRVRA